ncbi:sensor histidine kinase [Peribacillus saganii]|uniref:histidine kinase n=1 Tax=Peribacillus saganii TaxID=2303992 RepID=A0A372LE24_9BACI|nr:sensor histidine kinase [Peribacillus saganii]RFU64479.1 sensor histidine kinase [Peribacillus saganii]
MINRYMILLKSTGISPYIWTILSILPFYFIFQLSSTIEITIGILLTALFFFCYRFAFIAQGWTVYLWTILLIAISISSASLFNYIYFAFYITYLNGNIKDRIAFLVLYVIHLVATTIAINLNIVLQEPMFIKQLPIVIIVWIGVILLPFTIRSRKQMGQLEEKLEDANKRISELVKHEERQRIARDLHDTLGQKLSLIGLKSDLARKLIYKDPEQARDELKDVQHTARTALNEVRKMVSEMRGVKLKEEILRVNQILKAAQIKFQGEQDISVSNLPPLTENILSMCLKEAVNNVVKHSQATVCQISVEQKRKEIIIVVRDNGIGAVNDHSFIKGHGLTGMKERLEFVNGTLEIVVDEGTTLIIKVPNAVKHTVKEELT